MECALDKPNRYNAAVTHYLIIIGEVIVSTNTHKFQEDPRYIPWRLDVCSVTTSSLSIVFKMVWAWQLWLSPRPRRRTANTSQESFVTSGNAALYETVSKPGGLWAIKETHYVENPVVKAGLSGPPL
jgi:hypothetical protein